jgi:hypothetical protein
MPAKHDLTPLWPWLAGADARLSRAVRSGALSQTEVDRIVHLTEKGFVIFPQAIEADRIDALLGDVRRIGRHLYSHPAKQTGRKLSLESW